MMRGMLFIYLAEPVNSLNAGPSEDLLRDAQNSSGEIH